MPKPERQVLVCLNSRPPGNPRGSCGERGSQAVLDALKDRLRDSPLEGRVMVNKAGCLKHCSQGVAVAVQPDNVWYAQVTEADVAELFETHLEGGRTLERLLMPDIPWE
jgi:(2Fe-2S) ferredoxin